MKKEFNLKSYRKKILTCCFPNYPLSVLDTTQQHSRSSFSHFSRLRASPSLARKDSLFPLSTLPSGSGFSREDTTSQTLKGMWITWGLVKTDSDTVYQVWPKESAFLTSHLGHADMCHTLRSKNVDYLSPSAPLIPPLISPPPSINR